MAQLFYDRIRETTATTGTGPLTLAGAATGFLPFSTIGDTNTCYYEVDDAAANWEVGIGTYALGANTLTRTSVLASSNSNAAVSFGAGTKNVRLTAPAAWLSAIPNANLANSSVTISGHVLSLGGSLNLASGDISGLPSPANPTASIGLSAVNGSATTYLRSDGAPALSQAIAPTWTAPHIFAPAARSSGVAPYWSLQTPLDTGLTTGTEAIGVQIGGDSSQVSVTRTWAGSTTNASQREYAVIAPTYNSASATTITSCTTFDISGAPGKGANVTFGQDAVQANPANNSLGGYAFTIGGPTSPKFSIDRNSNVNCTGQIYCTLNPNDGNPFNYLFMSAGGQSGSGAFLSNWLGVFGRFPDVMTSAQSNAMVFSFQSATVSGSSAFDIIGNATILGPGYVGVNRTVAGWFQNNATGTSTQFYRNNGTGTGGVGGNIAFDCISKGATTGNNLGINGTAANGVLNIGVRGNSTIAANSRTNVGGAFFGLNTGTSPTHVGVYAGLVSAYPTWTSAALIADNGSTSSPVFLGQVNGVTKFTIDSSGNSQLVGTVTKYNNVATAGLGVAPIYGIDSRTGLTGADGAATTLYTTTAANQIYRVSADIFATAAVTGTASYTITWTENSTTQTSTVTATAINVLGTVTSMIRPDNATAITAQLTGTFTGTFSVVGSVERIA